MNETRGYQNIVEARKELVRTILWLTRHRLNGTFNERKLEHELENILKEMNDIEEYMTENGLRFE